MDDENRELVEENIRQAKPVIDLFHKIYHYSSEKTWNNTYWLGYQTLKCPLDLWIYQELIFELKPDLIIETGTHLGGSALYMAMLCDSLNKGKVVSIDVEEKKPRPEHKRINYLHGSSTADDIFRKVLEIRGSDNNVLVILDSEHRKDHVLKELQIYSPLIKSGGYLIVEDTNINGHPVSPDWGEGPMEAVEEFLADNNDFVVDKSREKFLMTQNPGGYLKRL